MTERAEIGAVAAVAMAGIDHRAFVRSTDVVERLLDLAVARVVLDQRREHAEERRKALAIEVGNEVGKRLGEALQAIARAMRG